jgi:predicted transcriptional regulator
MAGKGKEGHIEIKLKHGAFSTFFRRFKVEGRRYGGLDFSDVTALRQLLSNEKSRILWTLQNRKPSSIYELAKMLGRDFKSVRQDIELLKQFGFVRFVPESKGKRKRLKPILNLERLHITISL